MSCKSQLFFYVLLLCGVLNIALGAELCQDCMANSVYCADATSYYICSDGETPSNKLITCPKDTFCTNSPNKVCQPKSGITGTVEQPCATKCGTCPATTETHKRFVCVSRTQFDMCDSKGDLTGQYSTCDDDEVCNAASYKKDGKICVPECVMDFYKFENTCTSDEIIIPTEAPVPTIPTGSLIAKCIAADINTKEFFYLENEDDKSCRTYILCQEFETTSTTPDWEAALMTCKNGGYFDDTKKACGSAVPQGCPRT